MENQINSTEAGGEGSSNPFQDETCKTPMTAGTNVSSSTAFTFETADPSLNSTRISVTSESELLIAGKLHGNIVELQNCYLDIINKYDPDSDKNSKVI